MQIKDWLQKNPQAVLVENVVNKGPQLRAEVYALFAQKVQRVDLVKERLRYQTFLQEVHKNELKVVLQ